MCSFRQCMAVFLKVKSQFMETSKGKSCGVRVNYIYIFYIKIGIDIVVLFLKAVNGFLYEMFHKWKQTGKIYTHFQLVTKRRSFLLYATHQLILI